jgi:DNA uptake protein ComE-like DNA-binding protein
MSFATAKSVRHWFCTYDAPQTRSIAMHKSSWSLFACLALAAGCTGAPATSEVESNVLTTGDTDVPADCAGVLDFVNQATLATLDAYLPSNVASAIVARRASAPFASIADLSSVSGVAAARLQQIGEAARTTGYIAAACAGVYEELAVSADDRAAILTFVNTADTEAVINALRSSQAETIGPALVAARPFTTLDQLAALSGIGPSSFRGIRDAAVNGPFDQLVTAVNATPTAVTLSTGFDPIEALYPQVYGRSTAPICFGMPADIVAQAGGSMRPDLADAAEVMATVSSAVAQAGSLPFSSAPGLADLSAQVAGQSFYGCSMSYEPNPWCGLDRAFFVNTVTGYRVFVETGWCE